MKLYALCDKKVLRNRGISLNEFVNISKKHDAQIIQYRNKDGNIDEVKIYKGEISVEDIQNIYNNEKQVKMQMEQRGLLSHVDQYLQYKRER